MLNYFEILNVSISAEPEVIKASYRTLAKKYHPDSYKGSKESAEKKMAQINEAYQVLSDDRLRAEYILEFRASKGKSQYAAYEEKKEHASQKENVKSNKDRQTTEYSDYSSAYDLEDDKYAKIISWIIFSVVVISFICCLIHFGPSVLNEFANNLSEQIEELKYNFSL